MLPDDANEPPNQDAAAELAVLRARIDACNAALCDALEERGRLVRDIAALKRRTGLEPLDPTRERAMLAAIRARAADGYGADGLTRIFAAILTESRRLVTDPPTRDPRP